MKKINAREAFEAGLKRYFSGVPCRYGHIAERMVANGCCVECLNIRRQRDRKKIYERVKQWRLDNPGARTEEARRYRKKNPETGRKAALKYRNKNIEKIRKKERENARRIRVAYPEKEKERLERWKAKKEKKLELLAGSPRANVCEICSTNELTVFDHCHLTDKFRGWICDRCNKILGLAKDSPDLLRNLARYLENFNVKNQYESKESII